MTGKLKIDEKDVYLLYGVFVTNNGYKDLLAFPPLKPVESNDWAEEDGEEVDLSAPALDTREFPIRFSFHGNDSNFGAFIELLSDGAYHDFDFSDLGKIYRLRLVSQPDMSLVSTLGVFSLRFADDFPTERYEYADPVSSIVAKQGHELDGKDFSEYGVYILQGSDAEIRKSPPVKRNLLQNFKGENGVVYDGETVFFQTKEVKLNCLMRANDMTEFWRNYNALLFNLTRPGERTLYMDFLMDEYPCYYKNCAVSDFSPNGKIWFQFTLTLVFTAFRVDEYE